MEDLNTEPMLEDSEFVTSVAQVLDPLLPVKPVIGKAGVEQGRVGGPTHNDIQQLSDRLQAGDIQQHSIVLLCGVVLRTVLYSHEPFRGNVGLMVKEAPKRLERISLWR